MTKQKIILLPLGLVVIAAAGFFLWRRNFAVQSASLAMKNIQSIGNDIASKNNSKNNPAPSSPVPPAPTTSAAVSGFVPPLPSAALRVTKKPFGIYITPQNSPIQPEKFRGYHTGADFEIFPTELNAAVPVSAICDGKLILKEYASGYGGVAVEACTLNNAPVTVIYGHLKLASIGAKVGDKLSASEALGILGANKSVETDGERKHLHLGIHKGAGINILGYVQSKAALADWIDPCLHVCGK